MWNDSEPLLHKKFIRFDENYSLFLSELTGIETVKIDPLPFSLCTDIDPLCRWTISLAIKRPIPKPGNVCSLLPSCPVKTFKYPDVIFVINADTVIFHFYDRQGFCYCLQILQCYLNQVNI
jgi:hypothetical protein